ncbi:MAG: hypothetical protein V3U65_08550 [Granulosicoccaceae bacterium]
MNTIARAIARAVISAVTHSTTNQSPTTPKQYSWASIVFLIGLSACALTPSKHLTFTNPPAKGQTLPIGQRFFACQKISGVRYMASTGLMIAGCKLLQPGSATEYRVNTIRRVDLPEGEMWQIQLIGPEGLLWMPLPWHDWA